MLHTDLIASVPELLERHRRTRPDKIAYWDAFRSVTYGELANRTASLAVGLSKKDCGKAIASRSIFRMVSIGSRPVLRACAPGR